ncbi:MULTISPECIES: phage tail tape measure protein [unclassified Streptomyces]|uniref:phage tail tape measure protein n=1 Tax=unclassified Streptomyces TaxID=2593676 RepID=UPI003325EF47
MAEVADLFVRLRAETSQFTAGMAAASRGGESFMARMGGVQGLLTKVGAATTVVGLAFVAYGVKAAGDFQQQMNLLVTACGESQSKLKMVSDGVMALARNTGTSTGQLAEGMYQVEKAGYRAGDGLQVLKAAAQGAREEGADLKDVTNAMTSVMASYHLEASDSVRVMNALKTAAGEGKMTMQEFSASLATVIPIASANKVSFAEVGGAIATLSQHGTSAREATQELASTIRNLAAPNNVAVQEMQRLGLSSTDVATKLGERGLTGTLDLLSQTVLNKMGPSGTLLLSSFNQTKQAAENAQTMIKSMPASIQDLARSYSSGSLSLADWRKELKALPPEQANLLSQYATLMNKANGFSAELKKGGPAAQTYTEAIKKMTGGAIGLNTTLQLTGENTEGFKERVEKVGHSFNNASKDVEGWALTQQSFNVQMGRLKEAVTTAAIVVGTMLIPPILKVITFFEQNKTAAIALAVVVGGVLLFAMAAFTASLYAMAAAAAVNPVTWIVLGIITLITALVYLAVHWRQVWAVIQSIQKSVHDYIIGLWDDFNRKNKIIWHAITSIIMAAWRGLAAFFAFTWHAVVDPIVAAWNWVSRVTVAAWDGIVAFFRHWWPLLLVIFAPAIALIMSIWNHFHSAIVGTAVNAWNIALAYLTQAWNFIKAGAILVWGGIQTAIITPIMTVWGWLVSAWNAISGWLRSNWGGIKSNASSIWGGIRDSMITPLVHAYNTINGTMDRIGASIRDGLRSAWNSVKQVSGWFWDIGVAIVNGIVNGVRAGAGYLYSSLKNLAANALSAAKSFLGIQSPSRVFADQVGRNISEGVAQGIDDHAHRPVSSVQGLSGQLARQRIAVPSITGTAGFALAGGGGGSAGPTANVTVIVQGSVLAERDLRDTVEEQMLRLGMRNSATYSPYKR